MRSLFLGVWAHLQFPVMPTLTWHPLTDTVSSIVYGICCYHLWMKSKSILARFQEQTMAPKSTHLTFLKISIALILAAWSCVWILKPTQSSGSPVLALHCSITQVSMWFSSVTLFWPWLYWDISIFIYSVLGRGEQLQAYICTFDHLLTVIVYTLTTLSSEEEDTSHHQLLDSSHRQQSYRHNLQLRTHCYCSVYHIPCMDLLLKCR